MLGRVENLFHFWWLIFPLGGMVGGGLRAVAAANERRAERRLERYRIKQQTKIAVAEAAGRTRVNQVKHRRELTRVIEQHGQTDARWLDYEIDVAKLLDFPLMTDMRNPLTVEFHKARRRADLLRPQGAQDLEGDREAQLEYRDAVHDYVTAFDVAEAEAIRLRRSTFSAEDQQRIARAQRLLKLAEDEGATPQERRSAYAGPRSNSTGYLRCPPPLGPVSNASWRASSRRSRQAAPASGSRRAMRSSASSASRRMSCSGEAGMMVTPSATSAMKMSPTRPASPSMVPA
jgi:hypothetical protein